MVYDYVVTLKNERRKYVDFISICICILSVIFFIDAFISSGFGAIIFPIAAIIIAIITGYNIYSARKNPQYIRYYSRALMIAGLVWAAIPPFYLKGLSIPIILLSLVERYTKANLEVGFDNEQVVINTLFKKIYKWSDFSNIMLKDNILTLDFLDNKIIQQETIDEAGDADEDEFNAWCLGKLTRHSP